MQKILIPLFVFLSLFGSLPNIRRRFLEMDTADWLREFEGSGVPVGPINSIQEVFSSPQVSELHPSSLRDYSARCWFIRRKELHQAWNCTAAPRAKLTAMPQTFMCSRCELVLLCKYAVWFAVIFGFASDFTVCVIHYTILPRLCIATLSHPSNFLYVVRPGN